jgi:VWFA-related protein
MDFHAGIFRKKAYAALLAAIGLATAADVRIINPTGRVDVRAEMGAQTVEWHASSSSRKILPEDVKFQSVLDQTLILSQPGDGVKIDLAVTVPHTAHLTIETRVGDISLTGLIAAANLRTDTGSVSISTTWSLTDLRVLSRAAPGELRTPKISGVDFKGTWLPDKGNLGFGHGDLNSGKTDRFWTFSGTRRWLPFSTIQIDAGRPDRLDLADIPLPPDSWIRVPAEAASLLQHFGELVRYGRRTTVNGTQTSETVVPEQQLGKPNFRSDVRLVSLAVPIYDRDGHPVPGLTPDDFDLSEDDVPQQIAFANVGETPFNLILLLDLSSSTFASRALVQQAARDFIQIAQPHDRVAIHAISRSLFQVVSPLTNNRARLLSLIDNIPEAAGTTPLYDCMVLSIVQQPIVRSGEQSALVILTDGMDNQLAPPARGSTIGYRKLRAAVSESPVLIYTLLVPYDSPQDKWLQKGGREHMRQLSEKSGGRLFEVSSLKDLAPAYARVADELRSIYSIGYYPKNQKFDGSWRTIRLRSKRSGIILRTRPGYSAW